METSLEATEPDPATPCHLLGRRTGRPRAVGVRCTLLGALMFLGALPGSAQVSLVPARHPVYDWLRYQETLGHVDGYPHEALPLSRREIVGFLAQIETRRDRLAGVDRGLLDSYRAELSLEGIERSAEENFVRGTLPFQERIAAMHSGDIEPRLIAEVGEGYAFAFDVSRIDLGFRAQRIGDGARLVHGAFSESRIRSVVDVRDVFGTHVEAGNIAMNSNSLLRLDPIYGRTAEVLLNGKDNAVYVDAFASVRIGEVSADLGHGPVRYGAGAGPSLLLGIESSTHDWLRVRWNGPGLRYTGLAGSLEGADRVLGIDTIFAGPDTVLTRYDPERWLAMHRFTFVPSPSLEVSFSQAVVYSRRGWDLALLTPFGPALATQHTPERDNVLWMLDGTARPIRHVTLHAALLLDDLRPNVEGTASGIDVGAHLALDGGWELDARRVRLDPSLYAAPDTVNVLHQRGFPLGHPLGSNSEESSVSLRKWLPLRSYLTLLYARGKQGLNPVLPGGGIQNVGGDFLGPPVAGLSLFEDADVQTFERVGISGVAEPVRGVALSFEWERRIVTEGTRLPGSDRLGVWLLLQSPLPEMVHFVTGSFR